MCFQSIVSSLHPPEAPLDVDQLHRPPVTEKAGPGRPPRDAPRRILPLEEAKGSLHAGAIRAATSWLDALGDSFADIGIVNVAGESINRKYACSSILVPMCSIMLIFMSAYFKPQKVN